MTTAVSTTTAVLTIAETDAKRCAAALPRASGFDVLRAEGAQADEVRAWLEDRPESMGTAPERGIDGIAGDQRVVVCIVRGAFSVSMVYTNPDGSAPIADTGRYILPPNGEPVLDAAGPRDKMPPTPHFES
jgi:hypothetical protein